MGATKLYFKKRQPEPEQQTKGEDEMFAKVAEEKYGIWFALLADDIAEKIKITSGTVVDVGSGPGFLVKALGKKIKKANVVGIDRSPVAVKIAKKNCRQLSNVSIRLGDAYRLPFADHSVDAVVCRDSFHHFERPLDVLREMIRILKPGRWIYIQDLRRDVPMYLLQQSLPRETIFQQLQYYSVRASYTKQEMKLLIKKAGAKHAKIVSRKISSGLKKKYAYGLNWDAVRSNFQSHYIAFFSA